MKKLLIVIDMQRDFVDGALGTKEAQQIVPLVAKKIREFKGDIFVTYDTHFENYMDTSEGKNLPVPHCIEGTPGWELNEEIALALSDKEYTPVKKPTFGSVLLPELIRERVGDEEFSIELVGLCTDICVVSNALILKANFPEVNISVDPLCCAGVTLDKHNSAIETMRSCQIEIKEGN